VPDETFRLLVRGLDATGVPYQRLFPSSIDPHAPDLPAPAPSQDGTSDK
jgi:hypothetical protein